MNPKSDLRNNGASLWILCISIFHAYDTEVLLICVETFLEGVFLLYPFLCLKATLLCPIHQCCLLGQHESQLPTPSTDSVSSVSYPS